MYSKLSKQEHLEDNSIGLFAWVVIIGFLAACGWLLILFVNDPKGQEFLNLLFK